MLSDGNATSSTDTNSAEVSETASEATDLIPTEDTASSTASDNEHRGEIINGVFTSTDGIYKITVPEGVTLLTAADNYLPCLLQMKETLLSQFLPK